MTTTTFAVSQTVPVLRIFDVARAKEFYEGYLGMTVDWEHRVSETAPLYLQVSRGGLVLHLSEHHGDGTPGTVVWCRATGLAEYHAELRSKGYHHLNPGLGDDGRGGRELCLLDPFGNTLRLDEPPPA